MNGYQQEAGTMIYQVENYYFKQSLQVKVDQYNYWVKGMSHNTWLHITPFFENDDHKSMSFVQQLRNMSGQYQQTAQLQIPLAYAIQDQSSLAVYQLPGKISDLYSTIQSLVQEQNCTSELLAVINSVVETYQSIFVYNQMFPSHNNINPSNIIILDNHEKSVLFVNMIASPEGSHIIDMKRLGETIEIIMQHLRFINDYVSKAVNLMFCPMSQNPWKNLLLQIQKLRVEEKQQRQQTERTKMFTQQQALNFEKQETINPQRVHKNNQDGQRETVLLLRPQEEPVLNQIELKVRLKNATWNLEKLQALIHYATALWEGVTFFTAENLLQKQYFMSLPYQLERSILNSAEDKLKEAKRGLQEIQSNGLDLGKLNLVELKNLIDRDISGISREINRICNYANFEQLSDNEIVEGLTNFFNMIEALQNLPKNKDDILLVNMKFRSDNLRGLIQNSTSLKFQVDYLYDLLKYC